MSYELDDLLKQALQKGASDLHLKAGVMPVIRRHGILRPLAANLPAVTAEDLLRISQSLMDERQKGIFAEFREVDLSYGLSGLGRFRVNIFQQRGSIRMVIRNIPHTVPTIEELNLPPIISKLALEAERGLILVTGATGVGKSTTLAAAIDLINRNKNLHILTIEDPIEFLIRDRKSIVTQREIGIDATNYHRALRAAMRQDPDVILIGEMRDRETMETALTAAETGHLVFATLHTLDAVETVNRIVSAFDMHEQDQARHQLASVLKAVISQRMARKKDKSGFIPAVEVMINNPRIQELIEKKENTASIRNAIEESKDAWAMQSFDQHLMELVVKEVISLDEALSLSTSPEDFKVRYSGISRMDGKGWAQNSNYKEKLNQVWDGLSEIEIDYPQEAGKKASGDSSGRKK